MYTETGSAQALSPLFDGLTALESGVEELNKVALDLHERLKPLLASTPVANEVAAGQPIDKGSPIVDRIRTTRRGVEKAERVLREIIARLEV